MYIEVAAALVSPAFLQLISFNPQLSILVAIVELLEQGWVAISVYIKSRFQLFVFLEKISDSV